MKITFFACLIFTITLAVPVLAGDENPTRSIDDISLIMGGFHREMSEEKRRLVKHKMRLTEAEEKVFWPIYNSYQKDLYKIIKRLSKVVDSYDKEYGKGKLSNEVARILLNETLAIELAEVKLKQSYIPKLEKALPLVKVARYIQIETKIRAVIYHKIATKIPLIE